MRTQRSQHHCCARHTREGTPCRTQHAQHHSSVVTAGSGSALTPVPMHHFMQSSAGITMLPFVQKTSAPQQWPAFSVCHAQVVQFKKSGTLTACLTLHRVCCRSSLELANKRKLENLAFPAISTGVYGYPPEEAAEVRERAHMQHGSRSCSSNFPTCVCALGWPLGLW